MTDQIQVNWPLLILLAAAVGIVTNILCEILLRPIIFGILNRIYSKDIK